MSKTTMRAHRKRAFAPNGAGAWRECRSAGLIVIEAAGLAREKWLAHGFSTRVGGTSRLPAARSHSKPPEPVLNLGFAEWDERERVKENRCRFQKSLGAESMQLV